LLLILFDFQDFQVMVQNKTLLEIKLQKKEVQLEQMTERLTDLVVKLILRIK